MIQEKHCVGCHDNFYNCGRAEKCGSRKSGKMVWRIPVGLWERPPYKGKKKVRVPDCWHGEGSNRTIYVKPEALTSRGFWK